MDTWRNLNPELEHRLWDEAAIASFDQIEELLGEMPDRRGESRTDHLRVLIVPSLGVTFRVFAETGVVVVVDAWVIRRKHG